MRFTELPECLQAAYQRQPRRRPFARVVEKQNVRNNYLAEAKARDLQKTHSVAEADYRALRLGGRNAKGAGAPRGNRNAAGGGLYRLCLRRIRLKKQLDRQYYQLLVLAAAVEHLQTRVVPTPQTNFSQNNYLAEGRALPPKTVPSATPLPPPTPGRYNNYLARPAAKPSGAAPTPKSVHQSGSASENPPKCRPSPSRISQIPSVKRLDAMVSGLYG